MSKLLYAELWTRNVSQKMIAEIHVCMICRYPLKKNEKSKLCIFCKKKSLENFGNTLLNRVNDKIGSIADNSNHSSFNENSNNYNNYNYNNYQNNTVDYNQSNHHNLEHKTNEKPSILINTNIDIDINQIIDDIDTNQIIDDIDTNQITENVIDNEVDNDKSNSSDSD